MKARIGIAVVIVAAFALVMAYVVFGLKSKPLPPAIGGLVLEETLEGGQAREMLNQMHGKDMTPEQNRIGYYGGPGGRAVLYVSEYPTVIRASSAFELMSTRIARGSGPFTQYNTRNIEGRNISLCLGLGQTHYFFVDQDVVYWLAVDLPVASVSAEALVDYVVGR